MYIVRSLTWPDSVWLLLWTNAVKWILLGELEVKYLLFPSVLMLFPNSSFCFYNTEWVQGCEVRLGVIQHFQKRVFCFIFYAALYIWTTRMFIIFCGRSCAFYPTAPLLGMKRPKKRVIILLQIQWGNSTAKIWQTCKRPHFNKFLKSTNTNASIQAASNIKKTKNTLKLSSAGYLSLRLLRCSVALLNPQLYSHPCPFMGVKTLCLGKQSQAFPSSSLFPCWRKFFCLSLDFLS